MITNKILELRKKIGLSQEELAERINVSRQTISNWELGVTIPNLKEAMDLSKILNSSIDELACNKDYTSIYEENYIAKVWKKTLKSVLKKTEFYYYEMMDLPIKKDDDNNVLVKFPVVNIAKEIKAKYGEKLLEGLRKNSQKEINGLYFTVTEYYLF